MTNHTDGAVRAAEIFRWFSDRFDTPEIESFSEKDQQQLNAIIDQETAAERDRLRGAAEEALSWIKRISGLFAENVRTQQLISKIEAALAKETEGGAG